MPPAWRGGEDPGLPGSGGASSPAASLRAAAADLACTAAGTPVRPGGLTGGPPRGTDRPPQARGAAWSKATVPGPVCFQCLCVCLGVCPQVQVQAPACLRGTDATGAGVEDSRRRKDFTPGVLRVHEEPASSGERWEPQTSMRASGRRRGGTSRRGPPDPVRLRTVCGVPRRVRGAGCEPRRGRGMPAV